MNEGSSTALQPKRRMLRGHQPARALLLDISHTVEIKTWYRVLSAIDSFMSVVCNMAGPPRMPLVTIYLLDSFPDVMLPFVPPKGNLCRIVSAARDIRTCIEDSLNSSAARPVPCLAQGITEACGQYKRHMNAMGQLQNRGNVLMDQLEVVVLSGASQQQFNKQIEGIADHLDLTHLKRLVAALLTSTSLDDTESPVSSNSNSKDSEDSGIVDFVHLETDEVSLQKFFYTWLLDTSSEIEHLHLVLPPASPADKELLIKCDLVERIINPAQLPHHEFFNLHPDSTHVKMVYPCPSKAAGLTVPVYTIHVIAALPAEAICDSIVFGLPLMIQATTCWRIDWEELEENSANFHSLCLELLSKSQVFLVQLQNQTPASSSIVSPASNRNQIRQTTVHSGIRGMFVLLPAPSNTLLLKALATRELMLPSSPSVTTGEAGADSLLRVQSSMTQVPTLDSFNPLTYTSGLVNVLLAQAAPKQQAVKPRPAAKRKTATPKDSDNLDRTWSGVAPAYVTPTSGTAAFSIGHYSSSPSRGGNQRLSSGVGRNRVTATRRPDGFLVDLE